MFVLHGEILGGTMFHTPFSDYGAIGVNTKITILQVVGLAQGKKRQVSFTSESVEKPITAHFRYFRI